jgi:hypothetical protein
LETVLGAVVSIKGQVGQGILYGSPVADSFLHSGPISIGVALTALWTLCNERADTYCNAASLLV